MLKFINRHIGPSSAHRTAMLGALGVRSLDDLTGKIVPDSIKMKNPLGLDKPLSERCAGR